MKPNLDSLKAEILEYVESEGLVVFHGHSRLTETQPMVFWDTGRYSDYKLFVKSAKASGAKLMILNQREFSADSLDDAVEQLTVSDMPVEEQRSIERRLKELRKYEGFTCSLEFSFDYQGRAYFFDIQTDWYADFTSLLEDLEFLDTSDDGEDEDEGPIGGYFSKN